MWGEESGEKYLQFVQIDGRPTVEALNGALAALAEANAKRAPQKQLAQALAVITAVCAKPADFDDAKIVLWSERLKRVLSEYPAEIALSAINQWPRSENGKWWPTENELTAMCDTLMVFRGLLERALNRELKDRALPPPPPKVADGFSREPFGRTAAYVEEFRSINPVKANVYFDYSARYAEDRVGIKAPLAGLALERLAPGLLEKHGVRIVAPHSFNQDGEAEWMP